MNTRSLLLFTCALFLAISCRNTEEQITAKAKRIHSKALTLDSHVDTPMWLLIEGFDFGKRQDEGYTRSKLDIPRMKQGGLDGVFFAAFVGQSKRTAEGNSAAYSEAKQVIDSIYSVSERYSEEIEIALNREDFKRIAGEGRRAIFLGLENGYPIGDNLNLIDTFYSLGVRYLTLCHSHNNDICDSANDSVEHNGLSPFGREVIARMNNLGIMVDISHASDESFFQAIEVSRAPVIASHSCARAICDNPRNLSDDMLRALKKNGGVVQMCILSNYVRTPDPNPERDSARNAVVQKHGDYYSLDNEGKEEFLVDWYKVDIDFPPRLAKVSDVVDHIDHIVEIAGIDHVGIGTDFDGGGGVQDCFDVSQLGNITLELVRRGYSRRDIRKIWSGNLMRVLEETEALSGT